MNWLHYETNISVNADKKKKTFNPQRLEVKRKKGEIQIIPKVRQWLQFWIQ